MDRYGVAVGERHRYDCQGMVAIGRHGTARLGRVWWDEAWQTRHGYVRCDMTRQTGCGTDRLGATVFGSLGMEVIGGVGLGRRGGIG